MIPALQLHAMQSLTMTPQLQQSLRLLQLSALEFEQEILRAAGKNPFLETGRDVERAAPADGAALPASAAATPEPLGAPTFAVEELYADRWHASPRAARDDEEPQVGSHIPAPVGLREHLLEQVAASRLGERDRLLAAVIAEALDEDGYLRQSLDELAAVLPAGLAGTPEDLALALRFVQSLEPAGVGARSPAECLQRQLERRPADEPGRDLALAIVRDHLELLAAHDTLRLTRALGCDEPSLRAANGLILRLDPRPGFRFAPLDARYVVADVIVRRQGGRWRASVNPDAVPRLRVNELYARALRGSRPGGNSPAAQELQEARWLVRNVQHRFQTILRVAQAIVERQGRFLDHGDIAMKPLALRDVARALDLHESTVSRVARGKYMATPRGLVEFKRFFGGAVELDGGYACSATAVRELIRQIIGQEDLRRPLSDVKVMRMLGERGVRVARRTVTKYRGAMRIPPVEARRLGAG